VKNDWGGSASLESQSSCLGAKLRDQKTCSACIFKVRVNDCGTQIGEIVMSSCDRRTENSLRGTYTCRIVIALPTLHSILAKSPRDSRTNFGSYDSSDSPCLYVTSALSIEMHCT
jgi:hypothetical protein